MSWVLALFYLELHAVKECGLRQQLEGAAVIGRGAILLDGGAMVRGGITLIARPAILWILCIQATHEFISMGLGQDGGSGDAKHLAVALDDGSMRNIVVREETITVNEDALRAHTQLIQCTVHRRDTGTQDVDAVYLLGRDHSHSPRYRLALNDGAQLLALALGELLAVVD